MRYQKTQQAILALEDGRIFVGQSFGVQGEVSGEIVFNTSMMGYQEIITDPSYRGQIVAMTYPEIGNYGINRDDCESRRPFLSAFVVKEYHPQPSNYRSEQSLGDYLKKNKVMGLQGIDTRALTRHLRDHGAKMAVLSTRDIDPKSLLKKIKKVPSIVGSDLAQEVTCKKPYSWNKPLYDIANNRLARAGQKRFRVIAYDFGIKQNILRGLVNAGCEVTVVPASTKSGAVLKKKPDGVFLSNGPGDPEPVTYAIEAVRELIGQVPIFGICLGHQILSLALGGKTYKLKFGHHGANHPVKDLKTGKVEITAQNHGFAVDMKSLQGKADVTHINLNDQTVEGLRVNGKPIFSVQYHPEASPGPHDSHYLFGRFTEMMEKARA
jgi:carbamoyl-phosphate synthase small subunit